jgi:hypothetical protein
MATSTSRHELQERLNIDPLLSNIAVLGVDPGTMGGALARRGSLVIRFVTTVVYPLLAPLLVWLWPNGLVRTATKSAGDVMYAALDTKTLREQPKDVYLNGREPWSTSKESKQKEQRKQLWEDSIKYAGVVESETILKRWN